MEVQDNICNISVIDSEFISKETTKKNIPEIKSDKEYLKALANGNVLKNIEWNMLAFIILGGLFFFSMMTDNSCI